MEGLGSSAELFLQESLFVASIIIYVGRAIIKVQTITTVRVEVF